MGDDSKLVAPVKPEAVDDDKWSSSSDSEADGTEREDGDRPPHLPAVGTLPQTKESKTSLLFSKSQRKYLDSLKQQYKNTDNQALRAELVLAAAEHLLRRLEKIGVHKKKGEKAAFRLNVRRWFQQNCRVPKDLPQFGESWTGRRVLYHKHPELVIAEWKVLLRAAREDVPEADIEDVDDGESSDGDGEGKESLQTGTSHKRPRVKYFQTALSNVYGRLPDAVRKSYEKEAVEWKMTGPDQATQRKLAEKVLPRLCRHFAETVHKQMGVRLAMLLTYVVPNGNTAASFFDYTDEFGGRSFSKDFAAEIEKSAILAHWGAYAKGEFNDAGADDSDGPGESQIRKRGKPLMKLELNKFGEPKIPDPSVIPPGEQPNQYLPRLIRNIVIYTYARSCDREPRLVKPPWAKMVENVRSFIRAEYLPDELVPSWKEPTNITVKPARSILQHWYSRQQAQLIPLEIHNYMDGEELFPREPRQVIGLDDQDQSYEDEVQACQVTKVDKPRKKGPKASRKKPNLKGSINGEIGIRGSVDEQGGSLDAMVVAQQVMANLKIAEAESAGGGDGNDGSNIRAKHRLVVQSDSDSDEPQPSLKVQSPPEPERLPMVSHRSALDALQADPELAMLDDSVRAMALNVLKRHMYGSTLPLSGPQTAGSTGTESLGLSGDWSKEGLDPTSNLPLSAEDSGELVLDEIPRSRARGVSKKAKTTSKSRSTTKAAEGPSTQGRKRRTEVDDLLEMAAAVGAKTGRRSKRATEKARNANL